MIHARADYQRFQDPEGKIGEDEPVMLFRAQDKHFYDILCAYEKLLLDDPAAKPDIIQAVRDHRMRVVDWQDRHHTKTPDL